MKAFATLFALAACSYNAPADPTDGSVSGDGDAPPDMLIDDEDDDDDGVLDDDDNCPRKANPDQHDEDDDDTGDVCDPCPMFATDDDQDDDGDGIGDRCDPHPDTPGDVLITFEGFGVDGGLPAGWTEVRGSQSDWTVTDDAAELQPHLDSRSIRFEAGMPHVTVHFVVNHSMPGGSVPSVGGLVDGDVLFDHALSCSMITTLSSSNLLAVGCENDVCTPIPGSGTGSTNPTNPVRVITTVEPTNVKCSFRPGGGGSTNFSSGNVTATQTGAGVGVRGNRLSIPFIAIYGVP